MEKSMMSTLKTRMVLLGGNLAEKMFDILPTDRLFSPISIVLALSLVHSASDGASDKELTRLFGGKYTFDDLKNIMMIFNDSVVKMTNCVAFDTALEIRPEYRAAVNNIAEVFWEKFSGNSNVVQKINNFIERNTDGMIKNVLCEMNPDAVAVLVNTVYFKADWERKFSKSLTRKAVFKNSENTVEIAMMNIKEKFPYFEDSNYQLLELPYRDHLYSMGFALPKNSGDFQKMKLSKIFKDINSLATQEVSVFIPKFTHRKKFDLKDVLVRMGVESMFKPSNDLRKISEGVYIDSAVHEAVIIVDESGTEAAATTVAVCVLCTSIKKNTVFNADHSFIYYIRHVPTNTILFIGDYHGE